MTAHGLVPPLYEARTADWIRHHIERTLGLTHATIEELDEAATAKRCPSFYSACVDRDAANPIRDYAGRVLALRFDLELERLRMSRYRMGHLRYGVCGWGPADHVGSALRRLDEYYFEGNREHLVDIINLIEIEWVHPNVPGAYWDVTCNSLYPRYHDHVTVWHSHIDNFLREYRDTGNRRALVLAALLVEYEWQYPTHLQAHFEAQDCGGHWSLRNMAEL